MDIYYIFFLVNHVKSLVKQEKNPQILKDVHLKKTEKKISNE